MDFFSNEAENDNKKAVPTGTAKETLEQYIKVCGLIEYKSFYMKIKNGLTAIPKGFTKENYLMLAREVYESRAAKVNRQTSRSTYFAIRNKNKK